MHELVEKAKVVKEGWNGYNVLHDAAARVAALDIGFLPSAQAASAPPPKLVYLLGSDDYAQEDVPKDAFVIYQVSHIAFLLSLKLLQVVALADGPLQATALIFQCGLHVGLRIITTVCELSQ